MEGAWDCSGNASADQDSPLNITCFTYQFCEHAGGVCTFNDDDTYNLLFVNGGYSTSNGGGFPTEYYEMMIKKEGISLKEMDEDASMMMIVSGFALMISSLLAF